jgi:mRNA degradation ribonuclease J1/J2
VKTINPKILIPVHTENAKDFKEYHGNMIIPEKEKRIEI